MIKASTDLEYGPYILSVTTRNNGDDPALLSELTYRTVKTWFVIAHALQTDSELKLGEGSIESRFVAELMEKDPKAKGLTLLPKEPRVTVWDTFRGDRINFTLNSDDNTAAAVANWKAHHAAIKRLQAEDTLPPKQSGTGANSSAAHQSKPDTHAQRENAPNGVIVATRAPSPKRIDYQDGDLVLFKVNKVTLSVNSGSPIFQMWTALGNKYPTVTIYKKKPDGDLKPDFIVCQPILEALGLNIEDNPEFDGDLELICKVAIVGDKQYLNAHSLRLL